MVGFEKALGAVKVIKDQIQYRSQSLLNLARDYFKTDKIPNVTSQFLSNVRTRLLNMTWSNLMFIV